LRRTLTTVLAAATLALPVASAAAGLTENVAKASAKKRVVVTRKLVGDSIEADRWGTVKVNVTLRTTTVAGSKKATRRYVDLGGSYTYHTDRSQFIMSQALPLLREEFLKAQSANVGMISGATYTSQAFEQSLQSALAKA
jgi:uncharacterized protein with FMN-binding domain